MSDSVYQKLQEERAVATWKMLLPHHNRESLFLVDDSLDLLEVGVVVASDNALKLNHWLEADLVSRPTDEEVKAWTKDMDNAPQFSFIILQPFVFAQEHPPEPRVDA
jgi:hypothetical protein